MKKDGKQGIHTAFYVEPGVLLQHVAPMDLISMLGNLLDNAIRASAEMMACMESDFIPCGGLQKNMVDV